MGLFGGVVLCPASSAASQVGFLEEEASSRLASVHDPQGRGNWPEHPLVTNGRPCWVGPSSGSASDDGLRDQPSSPRRLKTGSTLALEVLIEPVVCRTTGRWICRATPPAYWQSHAGDRRWCSSVVACSLPRSRRWIRETSASGLVGAPSPGRLHAHPPERCSRPRSSVNRLSARFPRSSALKGRCGGWGWLVRAALRSVESAIFAFGSKASRSVAATRPGGLRR